MVYNIPLALLHTRA